jgi:hypothetical protein
MAGNKNSGGFRPTAPQNNPANISATGGAGQSGKQPARYMSGLAYGQGQAQMAQQTAAPMAGNPAAATSAPAVSNLPQITGITEPTQRPNEPVTHGIDMGPGAGSEAVALPGAVPDTSTDNAAKFIQALYLQDPRNEDVRRMLEYLSAEGRI